MASMSRSSLRSELVKQARIGANVSTTVLDNWLYEAVKQFQVDVKWLTKTRIYYVREYFSLGTDEGFKITLENSTGGTTSYFIGITTAQTDITGSALADYISSALEGQTGNTGTYVSWSTSDFTFSVITDTSVSSSQIDSITTPEYSTTYLYDASFKLFGLTDAETIDGTSCAADNTANYRREYPLPDDFLSAIEARYDDKSYPLRAETFKDRDTKTGTPYFMYISGDKFGLTPEPNTGSKLIELHYYYIPPDFSSDSSTHPFPEIFDYAIIYYAAYLYKQFQEDDKGIGKFLSLYDRVRTKAVQLKKSRVGGGYNLFDRSGLKYDVRRFNF